MVIDNSKEVVKDKKILYIMLAIFIMLTSIIMMSETFDKPVLGLNREFYAIVIAGIYLFINIYRFILNLNYINYIDAGGKIVFKYYSLRPFMQSHKTVEIPKGNLVKYEIRKSLFGQKKGVVLYQKVKNKTARYPEISLSAISDAELKGLIASLNNFSLVKA
jgi:hypothetical protein